MSFRFALGERLPDGVRAYGYPLLWLFLAALGANLVVCLIALWVPEMGDMSMYKIWAHRTFYEGMHQAYDSTEYRFDQLPLYLYISKLDGVVFHLMGFAEIFGPWGRGFSLLIKLPMIGAHLITGGLVVYACARLGCSRDRTLLALGFFLFNPGVILATAGLGYQDAFHTALVFATLAAVLGGRPNLAAALGALVCMTKPQAVIYLFPITIFGIRQFGWKWILRGGAVGLVVGLLALLPFVVYGELGGVWRMFLGITDVHAWLTGCAHNIWWIFWPGPPFISDRQPLLWGINGLQFGLGALVVLCAGVAHRLLHRCEPERLLELCAFLGFGFFMVVTEIHENHLYAMFAFLAPLVAVRRFWWRIYGVLSLTFALGVVLTYWLFASGEPLRLLGVRISVVNAMVNTGVLLVWGWDVFGRNRNARSKP